MEEKLYGIFLIWGGARAIAGIGLGYMVGVVLMTVEKSYSLQMLSSAINNRKIICLGKLLCSIIEISTLLFLLLYFLDNDITKYNNQFIIVIIFTILFVFLIIEKGIVSRILNNKLSFFLGRYSYSIYVMQSFSFWVLQKTLWQKTSFLENHIYISITISLLLSIALGGIAYHLIETPAINFFEKMKAKLYLCKSKTYNE